MLPVRTAFAARSVGAMHTDACTGEYRIYYGVNGSTGWPNANLYTLFAGHMSSEPRACDKLDALLTAKGTTQLLSIYRCSPSVRWNETLSDKPHLIGYAHVAHWVVIEDPL